MKFQSYKMIQLLMKVLDNKQDSLLTKEFNLSSKVLVIPKNVSKELYLCQKRLLTKEEYEI